MVFSRRQAATLINLSVNSSFSDRVRDKENGDIVAMKRICYSQDITGTFILFLFF